MIDNFKLILAAANCILRDNYKVCIAFPDEERSISARDYTLNEIETNTNETIELDKNVIKFSNGSSIEFIYPKQESEIIRGKKSELLIPSDDFYIDMNIVNSVLDEYMTKK